MKKMASQTESHRVWVSGCKCLKRLWKSDGVVCCSVYILLFHERLMHCWASQSEEEGKKKEKHFRVPGLVLLWCFLVPLECCWPLKHLKMDGTLLGHSNLYIGFWWGTLPSSHADGWVLSNLATGVPLKLT